MKKIISVLCACFTLTCSSCLTSLQPLVTADQITTDDRLAGRWSSPEGAFTITRLKNSPGQQELGQGMTARITLDLPSEEDDRHSDSLLTDGSYVLSWSKQGREYLALLRLIKINGELYGDLFAAGIKSKDEANGYMPSLGYMNTHTMAKIAWKNPNELAVSFFNGEYIKSQLAAGNLRLKHESDALYGSFLVTASSNELQQFLAKYGRDKRIYQEEPIILNRKS
ncbi:hypothetical protein MKQ68_09675 [Chitinophaga horti]|uniref:Lipocalin-like n=1 Tax=Chitinophaga horti TaxID=2920382 RepID=A0ABY6JAQ3_9BACT|nr:hypothetical protein [Chitinophaga horti]UYQ95366.1 hypothetical protein MKQ68_09675 [Chitinophaga horti]